MAVNYQIKLGDCIFCLIQEQNLLPETVWNHPGNTALRAKRRELQNLLPGDIVFIPDVRIKEVSEPTNQVHKFYLKRERHVHWIEIELIGEDDQPIPNEKYRVLFADGNIKEGKLNQEGWARVESSSMEDCRVTFPDLDKAAWEFINTKAAKQQSL